MRYPPPGTVSITGGSPSLARNFDSATRTLAAQPS